MLQQQETSNRLEMLLGSLIKMLGKTNERVDYLDKRVQQLESIIRESQMTIQEKGGHRFYAYLNRNNDY